MRHVSVEKRAVIDFRLLVISDSDLGFVSGLEPEVLPSRGRDRSFASFRGAPVFPEVKDGLPAMSRRCWLGFEAPRAGERWEDLRVVKLARVWLSRRWESEVPLSKVEGTDGDLKPLAFVPQRGAQRR